MSTMKSERQKINFNTNWKFFRGDNKASHLRNYDDTMWKTVHLPHSIALVPANSSGGRNYQGICYYRKHFRISGKHKGKKLFIEFEGAMSIAEIWVNSEKMTTHYGGYTPFTIDIADVVQYGEKDNVIAVRLDNTDNADVPPGKPQGTLDFSYDGGLYRNVYLHITNRLHITDAVYADRIGGGGIFVTYPKVSEKSSTIRVQTHILNETENDTVFEIHHTLMDNTENITGNCTIKGSLKAGEDNHFTGEFYVENPQLWHPYSPNLYNLVTTVTVKGKIVDHQITRVGIRTFEFTADKGFIINGKILKVSGANYHQTYVYVGNAVSDNMLYRDAQKLREAGFLHIRSHYPLSPAFVHACNEMGLTMTVSAPGWQWFREGVFVDRAYQNVRDMVRWYRNEPCVILWEPILNESNMTQWFQQAVHDIVHEEFAYEPCYTTSDYGPTDVRYQYDLVGKENHNPDDVAPGQVHRSKPLWVREYGDSPDNWTDQNCAWRVPRGWGEYPMLRQVEFILWNDINDLAIEDDSTTYIQVYNKKGLCGLGVWPGIEHNRGYHINPCWGGVLDLYRLPKFSYYFYRSQQDWDISIPGVDIGPMVFIANWWTETSSNDVTVYSNCEEIRLYHDRQLIETQKPDNIDIKHPPFTFKNVRRLKGRGRSEIKAEGLINGEVAATHVRYSPGVARRLYLEVDFMGRDLIADGSDLVMVYCRVLDDKGSVVPMTADRHPIRFSIKGEGKIVGDETIGANPICPEAGETGVLVQSTVTAGKIKLRAEMLYPQRYERIAIKPAEVIFRSRPIQKCK